MNKKHIEIAISHNFTLKIPKTYILKKTSNYVVIHNPLTNMPLLAELK